MCVCVCGNDFSICFFLQGSAEARKHAFLSMMGVFCCWPWGWPTTAWHNEKPWKTPPMAGHYPPWNYHRYQEWWVWKNVSPIKHGYFWASMLDFRGVTPNHVQQSNGLDWIKAWLFYKSNMDRKEPHSRWTRHFIVATIQGSSPSYPQLTLMSPQTPSIASSQKPSNSDTGKGSETSSCPAASFAKVFWPGSSGSLFGSTKKDEGPNNLLVNAGLVVG